MLANGNTSKQHRKQSTLQMEKVIQDTEKLKVKNKKKLGDVKVGDKRQEKSFKNENEQPNRPRHSFNQEQWQAQNKPQAGNTSATNRRNKQKEGVDVL